MSVDDHTLPDELQAPAPVVFITPQRRFPLPRLPRRRPRKPRPRLRKLRLLAVLTAFGVLALISAVFGMLMSVASDLPKLENKAQFSAAVDSYLYDDTGQPIGALTPPTSTSQQAIDSWRQISPNMVHAIVSVEDKRYWTDPGVDIRGLLRAALSDLTGGATQGASTIAEQFVKQSLEEQNNRTILEKLREAGLAFQLVHRWKRTQILTEYLNTIYFGNGGYGIESAARVYFGKQYGYNPADPAGESPSACGDPNVQDPTRRRCAAMLDPAEAALLAGMVANPSAFDPIDHPAAAKARRDLVLQDMLGQHYISEVQYQKAVNSPLPKQADLVQPQEPGAAPYFTSWVRPQIVGALERDGVPSNVAAYDAYYGGLKIKLTINLQLQQAAQQAIDAEFPPGSGGPTASLVAIDNTNGEVRAMVSGDGDYQHSPFNLATLGYRQPGSAFKLFTLVAAIESGEYGPDSVIDSQPLDIPFRDSAGLEHFVVRNFNNAYNGPTTLAEATAVSDNSVFAQVGMHIGTPTIKHVAEQMGIRSPISTNPAMILGGLNTGVSALDMAHAYETEATGGIKVTDPILGDIGGGPIGIHSISGCAACRTRNIANSGSSLTDTRVIPADVAATVHDLLLGPVSPGGTAPIAAIPGVAVAGKTGTTTNYEDAWFVGWTPQLTVAVWVGYPNIPKPMLTNYNGQPVEGGTFPALIWHDFMVNALQILASQAAAHTTSTTTTATTTGAGSLVPAQSATAPTAPAATGTTPPAATNTTPAATNTAATNTAPAATNATPTTPAQGAQTPATQNPTAPVQGTQTPAGQGQGNTPTTTPAAQPATPTPPAAQTPATPPSAAGAAGNAGNSSAGSSNGSAGSSSGSPGSSGGAGLGGG